MRTSAPAYSAADAAVLVQLAGWANAPLASGLPKLPSGWSLLRLVQVPDEPMLQAFFAQGSLPAAGAVVVLAVGAPWAPLMNWYQASFHSPQPYSAPHSSVAGAMFDEGYQTLYAQLGGSLWKALGVVPSGMPLVVTGHGQAAPLAQLAALDFAPATASQKTPFTSVSLSLFSAPALGNGAFATIVGQSLAASWSVVAEGLTPIDFFPSAPGASEGYTLGATLEPLAALLPDRDDPWWERSTTFYNDAFGNGPWNAAAAASIMAAPEAGYDADLAYALAVLCAGAYQRRQHPFLPFASAPWTLATDLASGGAAWASLFVAPGAAAIVFRGTVSWEELFTFAADSFLTQGNVLPNGAAVANGAWTVYSGLRSSLHALFGTIPGLSGTPLYVAGHGFGGSLATVCFLDLQSPPPGAQPPAGLYTYGAPPVASAVLAVNWPYSNCTFRFTRQSDIVPGLTYTGALGQVPTQISLPGATAWDDVTWHAVTSYVALLDPRRPS